MGSNVSIPSWQDPHSLQMVLGEATFLSLELGKTPPSPSTVTFKENHTLISSDQAEVRAISLASSAEMVSHLSSLLLGVVVS